MVKEGGREKGRFRMEVRNRKRLRKNKDRNEGSDGTREDGKTAQGWGQGQGRKQRDGLQRVGQDGDGESGGDQEDSKGWGESLLVRGQESGQTWISLQLGGQDMTGRGSGAGQEFREQTGQASGQNLG